MRRTRIPLVGLLCLCLVLVGCASDTGGTAGGQRLVWQMWLSGSEDRAAWQRVADQVTDDHPDLTVTLRGAPWENYWQKLGALLAGGSAPCLISVQGPLVAGYAEALTPLDDLMRRHGVRPEDFDQPSLQGMNVDGDQLGLPYDTGPIMLYYNRDLFEKKGVPEPRIGWSVADFRRAAAQLTGDGTYGFAPDPTDDFQTAAWVANLGGGTVLRDGELALTDRRFQRGYDQYVRMIRDGGFSPALPSQAGPFVENQFSSGRVAMRATGPWSLQSIKEQAKFEIGVVPLPAGPGGMRTISGGSGFGISESCSDPDAAFLALKSMTGPEALSMLGREGRALPTRPSVQDTWYSTAKGVRGVEEVVPYALKRAAPFRTTSDWSQLKDLLGRSTQEAISGEVSPGEALDRVQNQQVP